MGVGSFGPPGGASALTPPECDLGRVSLRIPDFRGREHARVTLPMRGGAPPPWRFDQASNNLCNLGKGLGFSQDCIGS